MRKCSSSAASMWSAGTPERGEVGHGRVAGVVRAPHPGEDAMGRVRRATSPSRCRAGSCSATPSAARRSASGCPAISAMNGSGKFPNDFIRRSVRCRAMGVKVAVVGGGSTYTPELVEGFVTRGDRLTVDELALLDIDAERLAVVGGLAERMLRARRMGRPSRPHRRPGSRTRGRRLRTRAAAGRRPGRPVLRRDDPAAVRVHRAGDDRSRRVREGAADGAGGAGARGGDRAPRRPGRLVRGFHEPHGAGHAGPARRGTSGAGAVQRRDRVPAALRGPLRRRAPSACSSSTSDSTTSRGSGRCSSTASTDSRSSSRLRWTWSATRSTCRRS